MKFRWIFICCGFCLCVIPLQVPASRAGGTAVRPVEPGMPQHRPVAGSLIDDVMIDAGFRCTPQQLYRLVNDYGRFAEFIPGVVESRVLDRDGPVQWVYHHLRFPGPVTDRVYILESTATELDDSHWEVSWKLSARRFPALVMAPGIRPAQLSGYWEIATGDEPGTTRARYAVHSDPGGRIPAWLVTRMTDRYVLQVVSAVRRRLKELEQ